MRKRPDTIRFYRGRLPHWEVHGGRYFVTIRLAGSIPPQGVDRIKRQSEELRTLSENQPEYLRLRRKIFLEMESWLDRSELVQHLGEPEMASEVVAAIEHREVNGIWTMFSYAVMPNHLHLFFSLGEGSETKEPAELKETLNGFKKWLAVRGKETLGLDPDKPFWQREWFDHWSRSHEYDRRFISYIHNNPVKAGLVSHPADWPYSG